jgi:hypothetical protein
MSRPRLLCKPSSEATRLYLTHGGDELLRAVLPPPGAQHPTAAPTLLEGLSLWLQRPLSVVLCADAEETSSALGLCDGFGIGRETLHYEVEVVDPRRPCRGLGSFRDLRQLALRVGR